MRPRHAFRNLARYMIMGISGCFNHIETVHDECTFRWHWRVAAGKAAIDADLVIRNAA
jgi:hypothetical protein